ncbi:phosphorylase family protein [Hymenobacter cheonanensis]|uniref:phosphorylase family protein n=1 Tax=Hymenobacter sp. CA2-7 TaxID=3063993 RepID=UPI0027124E88|nr:hypothetical protein [Hymenobacter sp. CA2-7]MDO7887609.1 hypothetical protein [Hymenobacter sp. CA2-7]
MKVLIVEDDANKCRKVSASLVLCGISIESIEHVTTSYAAKRNLIKNNYDLMILDVVIPSRLNEELNPNGGIDLLHDITDNRNYCAPSFVIGLTQLSERFASIRDKFSDKNFTVIEYDETSEKWSDLLSSKVNQMILANQPTRKRNEYNAFGVFICALESELTGVLENGWVWEEADTSNDHTLYYKANIVVNGEVRKFYAASCSRVGLTAAAVLSTKMIALFQPKYIIMPGIMAGVKGRVELGDVVVADPVWDYGSGKFSLNDNEINFLPEPYQFPLDSELKAIIERIKRTPEILFKIKSKITYHKPRTEPNLHLGPIGSGAAVLADGKMIKDIENKQQRKLLGIEMESYSVFLASQEGFLPKPKPLSIKSVVDFADGSKNDDFHSFAIKFSANLASYIFENYL